MRTVLLSLAFVLAAGCSQSAPPETSSPTPTGVAVRPTAMPSASPSPPAESHLPSLRAGTDLTLQGRFEQALPHLKKAESLAGDDPDVVQQLFLCHAGLEGMPNRKGEAYRYAQKVIALVPEVRAARAREYVEAAEQPPLPQSGKRPADVKGFAQVTIGMSEAEVESRLGDRLEPFSGPYSNPGHYVPFYIPRYYFGTRPYSVLFPFDSETSKLDGVYIRPVSYPSGNRAEFLELTHFVTRMYGDPNRQDDLENELVSRLRYTWLFPSSEVHVSLYNERDLSLTIVPAGQED